MVILVLVIALAATAGIAIYKHGSLTAAETSAKKEYALLKADVVAAAEKLEVLGAKVEADAKTDFAAVIAKLKSL